MTAPSKAGDQPADEDGHVLPAAEDLESIEATLELLTDPQAQERIRRSEADFARSDVLEEQDVRALVAGRSRTQ